MEDTWEPPWPSYTPKKWRGEISPELLEPGAVQPPTWSQLCDTNPGTTATASSISLLLPITDVNPQLTPLLFRPTHFSLAGAAAISSAVESPDVEDSGSLGTAASNTRILGISSELLLVMETSQELLESSAVKTDDRPELVDANSRSATTESTRSNCSSSKVFR